MKHGSFLLAGGALAMVFCTAFFVQPDQSKTADTQTFSATTVPRLTAPQPLTQASVEFPAYDLVKVDTTGISEAELNQRLAGLLHHTRWLMDKQLSEYTSSVSSIDDASLGDQVKRLERQIFRYMDDASDDRRDLAEGITESGTLTETTLNNPALANATLNATTTLNGDIGVRHRTYLYV